MRSDNIVTNLGQLELAYDTLDLIVRCQDAEGLDEATRGFRTTIGARSLLLMDYRASSRSADQRILWRTKSADWTQGYGLAIGDIDPVPEMVTARRRPVRMRDCVAAMPARASHDFVQFLREADIRDFIVVPVMAREEVVAGLGLHFEAAAEPLYPALAAALLGQQVFSLAVGGTREPGLTASLTVRERECLQWAASGKTSWEIGEILGAKERTVIAHLARAGAKMGADNRIQAVANAIRYGLIT